MKATTAGGTNSPGASRRPGWRSATAAVRLDPQRDALRAAGVDAVNLYHDLFAALAEFERELIRERTVAGLEAARARGRKGGRKFALTKAQVRLAQAAMVHRDTSVSALCRELGIRPVTFYRYIGPQGELRASRARRSLRPGAGGPRSGSTLD